MLTLEDFIKVTIWAFSGHLQHDYEGVWRIVAQIIAKKPATSDTTATTVTNKAHANSMPSATEPHP